MYIRFFQILTCGFCFLLCCFSLSAQNKTQKFTISGFVKEKGSRELLPGVSVFITGKKIGTQTNNYGFYSITLISNPEEITISFSSIGYQPSFKKVVLNKEIEMNVELLPDNTVLEEIVVKADAPELKKVSETAQMGVLSVPVSQIKEVPSLLGEKDVLKVLQLMPGIQKGSEGNSGLYVRGGGPDQNLLILDDAPVYNAYHLFGFFSVFNGDALKSVELTKGGFPARYGGRLSSVIEMQMKEGHKEQFHAEGGIGLISSRLVAEGPISKNHKSSFLISGRRTYIDALAGPFLPSDQKGSTYYFYDLNAKINYDFGRNNRLYLSGYFGKDKFAAKTSSETQGQNLTSQSDLGLDWGNATGTFRWNHLFNDQLFSNISVIYSNYEFNTFANRESVNSGVVTKYNLSYKTGIRDYGIKIDFDLLPDPQHTIKMGGMATQHRFTPSAIILQDTDINQYKEQVDPIDAFEMGGYFEDTYQPVSNVRINGGFRLSYFVTQSKYLFFNPEPRLSVAWTLRNNWAVKGSYADMNQYIHLLSNSGVGLPTDLWVPTTKTIKPQRSRQLSLGFAKDFTKKNFALTFDAYYKQMDKILALKEGSSFLLLDGPDGLANEKVRGKSWEDNVTAGQGWAYGGEFLLQKKQGRLTGWIGYTLSWIEQQFDELNFGKKFYAKYDRRHDFSAVGIYHLSPKITLSGTWVYGTGNAITLPNATYIARQDFAGENPLSQYGVYTESYGSSRRISDYGERNTYRAAAYHRMDVAIQLHKKMKKHERIWEFSIYNLYNRKNPFFYDFNSKYNPETKLTQKTLTQYSLFSIIPSVSYSFKF